MYIDSHVHCRDGKQAYKETIKHALEVAHSAGVDAIFDMPNTDPPITNTFLAEERLRIAESCNSSVFYGLYVGLTSDITQIKEAVDCWKKLFPRVVGLKMFAGKSVGELSVIDANEQMKVYKTLSSENFSGVLVVHCEKESFMRPEEWSINNPVSHCNARPSISELASVNDQILFALNAGFCGHLHIAHVSCPESVEYINMMKKNYPQLKLSCGATPHHLFLNEEFMKGENGRLLKVNPPLRNREEQRKLLEYLKKGMIDWIETDHAPHSLAEKLNSPFMSGIPWLDQWPDIIELLKKEGLTEEEIENLTFNNASKVFGIGIKRSNNLGKYYKGKRFFPVSPNSISQEFVDKEYDTSFDLAKINMKINKIKIGDKEVMPFTIPSGIITTNLNCLKRVAEEIPEIGILTTKSIGPEVRAGNREPILAKYAPGCFVNAVGLTNLGAQEFARELAETEIPKNKFLLASIFGKNSEEFVSVAKILNEHVDGFELNLSCPHAKGYGMQLGQDCEIVGEITKAVVNAVNKPVLAKLTPNAKNIGEIAKGAIDNGACGIVAINTVGPGYYSFEGNPVLTNKLGGLSGAGILPIGLKCIKEIREAIGEKPLIIAMGGIRNARDIEAYSYAGANAFGIGSSLAGMTENEIKNYFLTINNDVNSGKNDAEKLLKNVDMSYRKVKITEILNENCDCGKTNSASILFSRAHQIQNPNPQGFSDFKVFKTNINMKCLPGQFVFAWIPGFGEKPFSVMDDEPLTLGILERGEFTKKFNTLKVGDEFYIRGPYGEGVDVPEESNVVLVGGGCGVAGLYILAKAMSKKAKIISFVGARDKGHLPYLDKFKNYGEVYALTEDGSVGRQGLVTDLFSEVKIKDGSYFFNCGPRAMVNAVIPLELKISNGERIFSSVDFITRCGVGICGSCSDKAGFRTCVEGPFMNAE